MKPIRLLLIAGCAAVLWAGCQFPGPRRFDPRMAPANVTNHFPATVITNQPDASLLQPPSNLFTLGPGDRLEIELIDDYTSRTLTTVGPDGKIYFSMLPGIDVWGLTLAQARDRLEQELGKFMREKPQISVILREVASKKLWLLGRLAAPGVYPMTNSLMTLLEAVYLAGGPLSSTAVRDKADFATFNATDELADLSRSFVLREGKMLPVDFERLFKGDLSQNIYLQPEDFVYLRPADAKEVHVIGAVAFPHAVPYAERMTLSAVIANAGSTVRDAYMPQVAIVRGSLQKPQIALVDLKAIFQGKDPDLYVMPGDIVYVPYAPYRLLTRYWDVITSTFVSSVAINEGSRAVLDSPPPTTGILIPFGSQITVTPGVGR